MRFFIFYSSLLNFINIIYLTYPLIYLAFSSLAPPLRVLQFIIVKLRFLNWTEIFQTKMKQEIEVSTSSVTHYYYNIGTVVIQAAWLRHSFARNCEEWLLTNININGASCPSLRQRANPALKVSVVKFKSGLLSLAAAGMSVLATSSLTLQLRRRYEPTCIPGCNTYNNALLIDLDTHHWLVWIIPLTILQSPIPIWLKYVNLLAI